MSRRKKRRLRRIEKEEDLAGWGEGGGGLRRYCTYED